MKQPLINFAATILLTMALGGCSGLKDALTPQDPTTTTDPNKGKGTLVLQLQVKDTEPNTAITTSGIHTQAIKDISKLEITCTSGSDTRSKVIPIANLTATTNLELTEGSWTIQTKLVNNLGGIYYSGSATVAIQTGQTSTCNMVLNSTKSKYRLYMMNIPSSVATIALTLTNADFPLISNQVTQVANNAEVRLGVNAGTWQVKAKCFDSNGAQLSEQNTSITITAGTPINQWMAMTEVFYSAQAESIAIPFSYIPPANYYVGNLTGQRNWWAIANYEIRYGYMMAQTEVTWALWKTVYDWAVEHGYVFGNAGQCGATGKLDQLDAIHHPVTMVSRFDCMAWCNALSELNNLDPVYLDSELNTPIKNSNYPTQSTTLNRTIAANRNGFRLPTQQESEIAARGAIKGIENNSYGQRYSGSDVLTEVGSIRTSPVAQKHPNCLNLYDMSGNADEIIWINNFSYLWYQYGYVYEYSHSAWKEGRYDSIGFRICRSY